MSNLLTSHVCVDDISADCARDQLLSSNLLSANVRRQQQDEQYAKYLNRFGPGAVIYWYGFSSDLADINPNILVLGDFPYNSDIVQLRQIALPD